VHDARSCFCPTYSYFSCFIELIFTFFHFSDLVWIFTQGLFALGLLSVIFLLVLMQHFVHVLLKVKVLDDLLGLVLLTLLDHFCGGVRPEEEN